MFAAIDVGSNTVRMLVARCLALGVEPVLYRQIVTRLAGDYLPGQGLAAESIERTFQALVSFAEELKKLQASQVRVVGTAALRQAENASLLINLFKLKTGLPLEILSGTEEALLSSSGVLSELSPCPENLLTIDIGGGSTEIVFCQQGQVCFSGSYPIGVVRLCEEFNEAGRQTYIRDMTIKFAADLLHSGLSPAALQSCEICGTAGTVTTLAALDLKMERYDPSLINNHSLSLEWLETTLAMLAQLTVLERENLPGIEPGRGDLIVPGLEMVISLCRYLNRPELRVVDAGLLEGILLNLCGHRSD